MNEQRLIRHCALRAGVAAAPFLLSRRRLLFAGAATFLSGPAAAQRGRAPVIGVVRVGPKRGDHFVATFSRHMSELGWEEGRTFQLLRADQVIQ